jgi:hypothetical protein
MICVCKAYRKHTYERYYTLAIDITPNNAITIVGYSHLHRTDANSYSIHIPEQGY